MRAVPLLVLLFGAAFAVPVAAQDKPKPATYPELPGEIPDTFKPVIDNLRSIGVATVAAAGNSGSPFSLLAPACVSSAVSVGATTKTDDVAWFSNVAPFLSVFAPGESIRSR